MYPIPSHRDLRGLVAAGALAAGALALLACTHAAPATPGAPAGVRDAVAPRAAQARAGGWIACQLHAHSRRSGYATDDVAELVAKARFAGIEALAVTDHDEVAQNAELAAIAPAHGVIALPGTEWTRNDLGHANLYGFRGEAPFAKELGLDGLLAEAERRDAVAVINHPRDGLFAWRAEAPGKAHAVEVWNAAWGYANEREAEAAAGWEALDLAQALAAPAPTRPGWTRVVRDVLFTKNVEALAWWQAALREGARLGAVGGSDYHRWPQALASPVTFVWAETRDAAGVLAGLRAGRTMIARAVRGPRVTLTADVDGDGRDDAMVGDAVRAGATTRFRLHVTDGAGLTVRLESQGGVVLAQPIRGDDETIVVPAGLATHGYAWARLEGGLRRGYMQAMTSALYLLP